MANDLRLQVIMDLANKATAPLRSISASSSEAAKALKAARDQLKQLEQQQATIDNLKKQQSSFKDAAEKVKILKLNLETLRKTQGENSKAYQDAVKTLAAATAEYEKQKSSVIGLRRRLKEMGIGSTAEAQQRLKAETAAATAAIEQQRGKLKQLADQHKKLADLKSQHGKDMMKVGMVAGAGVGMQAAGRGMAQPVLASVSAYAQQESATSQLAGSMMLADGSVSAEFKAINDLAMRLGDRLPGTTADFIEMMTMLRRQGLTAQTILGGTGEAAAYLGVQLRMPATQAAEFAAKMQDATRTTERDMMALMDTIQRTYYLGVDSNNMLQGFTKVGPALSILHQEGLQAANTLAPLLVMMDQTGMAGEAAGNGLRKVFQGGLDLDKLKKANKLAAKSGFQLNFVDKKGQFAGLDNLFAQLQKIKGIQSDVDRINLIKTLFGDDAENLQVLNTLMDKGLAGYNEIAAKMKTQADLRKRVDAELGTLANLWEAATGSFTNVLAEIGLTIAPQARAIVTWLGEVAGRVRGWVAENPRLVGTLTAIVATLAAVSFALGTLAVSLAAILGPMLLAKFMFARLALGYAAMGGASGVAAAGLLKIQGLLGLVIRFGTALWKANPVVAAVVAIGMALYDLTLRWDQLKALFNAGEWMKLGAAIWEGIEYGLNAATMGMYGLVKGVLQGLIDLAFLIFDVNSPSKVFAWIGSMLMDGLVQGITSRLSLVKTTISDAATSVSKWFNETLGIHSPSRVFIDAGLNIGQGAAIGIGRSLALVRQAGAGLAAATAIGMPGLAGAQPPLIDSRPPLSSAGAAAGPATSSSPISITINAAPGMDAKAIASAVAAELDRRQGSAAARRRATLGDIA